MKQPIMNRIISFLIASLIITTINPPGVTLADDSGTSPVIVAGITHSYGPAATSSTAYYIEENNIDSIATASNATTSNAESITADSLYIRYDRVKLPTPTREGFIFIEWNDAEDGTGRSYAAGSVITITNKTLFAVWEENIATPANATPSDATPANATPSDATPSDIVEEIITTIENTTESKTELITENVTTSTIGSDNSPNLSETDNKADFPVLKSKDETEEYFENKRGFSVEEKNNIKDDAENMKNLLATASNAIPFESLNQDQ